MRRECGLDKQAVAIENERCKASRLYAMFRRPTTVLPGLFAEVVQVLRIKYSPDLEQDRMFHDLVQVACESNSPGRINLQQYVILAALCRDPEVSNMLGATAVYVDRVKAEFHRHQHESFGEVDIVPRVEALLVWCEGEFLRTTTFPSLS